MEGEVIESLSSTGGATAALLKLNAMERLTERRLLREWNPSGQHE